MMLCSRVHLAGAGLGSRQARPEELRGRRNARVFASSSGGQDAEESSLPQMPKQRRRRRKQEPEQQPFRIDDLNPVTSRAFSRCVDNEGSASV